MELVRLLILRSRARLNRHDFDEAITDALEARSLDPYLGHSDLRLAQLFRAEYRRTLEPLFDRVHREPTAAAYMDLGLAFFEHGQHSNAATYFQLAAAAAVGVGEELERAEALNNLAGTYLESGFPIAGLRAAARAVALNPHISKVNFNFASMRLKPMGLDPDVLRKDRFETLRASH
jgi:tetratricopeptide (TPR) repeat protein